jgi:hypothetical protein
MRMAQGKVDDLVQRGADWGNRGRVPPYIMNEIGYEDCDWISHEVSPHFWVQLATMWPLELHVPCRDPLEHLMSQCNYEGRKFDCSKEDETSLLEEITACLVYPRRFDANLLFHTPNLTLKCFNPIPVEPYVDYMSQYLRRRRIETKYFHRSTNRARNKTKECIWENETVAAKVRQLLLEMDLYSYCDHCIGTGDDLLFSA